MFNRSIAKTTAYTTISLRHTSRGFEHCLILATWIKLTRSDNLPRAHHIPHSSTNAFINDHIHQRALLPPADTCTQIDSDQVHCPSLHCMSTSNMSSIEKPGASELARQLAAARADGQLVDITPFESIASLDDAYNVQMLAIEQYNSPRIGYKVGATNEAVQKLFGADSPFFGPIFEREHYPNNSTIQLLPGVLGGEAEFAFICSADFPSNESLSADDLPDLIQSCHIAVEIVGRRTEGDGLPSLNAAVADFGANVAFIDGPSLDNWQSINLASINVTASTDGVQTNNGTGAAVLGNPLNSLLWLHNALQQQNRSLRRGDWVSTGTCLGVIAAVPGSTVDIEFEGCGQLSYRYS